VSRARLRLAAFFLSAGTLHLTLLRRFFESIVPPWIPVPRERVNEVAGAAEIAGGVLALVPGAERHARRYLTLLLLAVFPANIHMALRPADVGAERLPSWSLWARLPLQFAIIRWVQRVLAGEWALTRSAAGHAGSR
jgi:uncharacterized membrane protein